MLYMLRAYCTFAFPFLHAICKGVSECFVNWRLPPVHLTKTCIRILSNKDGCRAQDPQHGFSSSMNIVIPVSIGSVHCERSYEVQSIHPNPEDRSQYSYYYRAIQPISTYPTMGLHQGLMFYPWSCWKFDNLNFNLQPKMIISSQL